MGGLRTGAGRNLSCSESEPLPRVAAGLLLRGVAGIVWALGIGSSRETTFYWLNLTAYTPVCPILCVAAAAVAQR